MKYLRDHEAAAYLNVKTATVRKWRITGGGPEFVRLGKRAVRYLPEDLDAFAFVNGRKRSTGQ